MTEIQNSKQKYDHLITLEMCKFEFSVLVIEY